MRGFLVTFGFQYGVEAHPVLGFMPELPKLVYWLEAEDELEARRWLTEHLDNTYAFIYEDSEADRARLSQWYDMDMVADLKRVYLEATKNG